MIHSILIFIAITGKNQGLRNMARPLRVEYSGTYPHLHVLAANGCFCGPARRDFMACPKPDPKDLDLMFTIPVSGVDNNR